jgi:hypothetical protein
MSAVWPGSVVFNPYVVGRREIHEVKATRDTPQQVEKAQYELAARKRVRGRG